MKRQMVVVSLVLSVIFSTVTARSFLLLGLPSLTFEDSEVKQEINNSLDYMMKNNQEYLSNPMLMSSWVMSKVFLGYSDNRTEVINYLNSRQESDGGWSGTWTRMFTTHRVLFAYYLLNATPARSLDTFFSDYDTWDEARTYLIEGGRLNSLRNMYHILFSWAIYYKSLPLWINDYFADVESDLSWTTSTDYHGTTHTLYSYVLARRSFPNLDGIIGVTFSTQEADGHWDGSQYSFGSPVYFTSIQITLLSQILRLYPGYRNNEITTAIEKTKGWTNSSYHTAILDGKVCGYFGDVVDLGNGIFAGILCAGQNGIISANVDMTFQSLVDTIAMERASFEYSPEKPIVYEQIGFNASASYSPGGNITSYEWNFDDGNTTEATSPIINHSYALPGNYTVTLKVTDGNSLWNTTTKTITVYSERVYAFDVSWQGSNYTIIDVSNSTVANFNFNYSLKQISFNVTGLFGTTGYCNVSIPKTFMWCDSPSEWNVSVDGSPANDLKVTEDMNTSLFFTYSHSTHEVVIRAVNVVPEFPSASILLLFMIVVLIGAVLAKRDIRKTEKEAKSSENKWSHPPPGRLVWASRCCREHYGSARKHSQFQLRHFPTTLGSRSQETQALMH